jgi:glutamate dehydrogenase/leucine dehydrogenase
LKGAWRFPAPVTWRSTLSKKRWQLGARVVTASDSSGTVVDEAGFTRKNWRACAKSKPAATAAWRITPASLA